MEIKNRIELEYIFKNNKIKTISNEVITVKINPLISFERSLNATIFKNTTGTTIYNFRYQVFNQDKSYNKSRLKNEERFIIDTVSHALIHYSFFENKRLNSIYTII